MSIQIGQEIIATVNAPSSFYKKVQGRVVGIKNEFVQIKATKVISKWSNEWKDHPTQCGMSVKLQNIVSN